jgi:hypothetical protein
LNDREDAETATPHPRRGRFVLAILPPLLAGIAVLTVYVFFASGGHWEFRRITWFDTIYASLGEGFLRGDLSLAWQPDPRLGQLENPWDKAQRESQKIDYLWDTSYFRGRYYVYFTPLPVLIFHIPYRLVSGGWPMDQLVSAFFAAWAFLAATAFVAGAVRRRQVPLPLWMLLAGVGNLVPFTLIAIRVYELSILTGMAMSATWAWATLRFLQTGLRRHAAWSGFWLAMSIVARPNLIILLVAQLFVLRGARPLRKIVPAMLAPLIAVGLMAGAYNAMRFGNPLEFGVRYQLTGRDMRVHSVCGLCSTAEAIRLVNGVGHYVFWAPAVTSRFPFVTLLPPKLDPYVTYPGAEAHAGAFALIPVTLPGTCFAVLLALRRRDSSAGTRAGTITVGAAWLVLTFLSSCWYIVGRYSLDFSLLLTMGSVVCIEHGLAWLEEVSVRTRPIRIIVVLLALYSIVLGVLLGFSGPNDTFKTVNPELFEKAAGWMGG